MCTTCACGLKVNGTIMQDGNTSNLIFNIPYLVAYTSQFMTLLPGDIISTGTPAGVGLGMKPPVYLKDGDVMELGIDGLGEAMQIVKAYTAFLIKLSALQAFLLQKRLNITAGQTLFASIRVDIRSQSSKIKIPVVNSRNRGQQVFNPANLFRLLPRSS